MTTGVIAPYTYTKKLCTRSSHPHTLTVRTNTENQESMNPPSIAILILSVQFLEKEPPDEKL